MNTSSTAWLVLVISLFAIIFPIIINAQPQSTVIESCSSIITWVARSGGAWEENGLSYQTYDITVTNNGSCTINNLIGVFSLHPTAAFISEAWNYNITTGEIGGFGGFLSPGQVFVGAGFVLAGGAGPTLSLNSPSCPGGCGSHPIATSAPSVAPTSTVPTSVPSTPTAAAPTSATRCSVTVVITARPYASFLLNGVPAQIYDLDVINSGSSTVSDLIITISLAPATIIVQDNKWNLEQGTDNKYSVLTYGGLTAGATYHGAGFVLAGTAASTATPSVSVFYVSC